MPDIVVESSSSSQRNGALPNSRMSQLQRQRQPDEIESLEEEVAVEDLKALESEDCIQAIYQYSSQYTETLKWESPNSSCNSKCL